jgi:hypothetical protein
MDDLRKSRADEAFSSVTREDVQQALNDLDRGVDHPFGPSTTYDLLYDSRRYPPKAVIARAAKNRTGIELVPDDSQVVKEQRPLTRFAASGSKLCQKRPKAQ